MHGSRNRSRFTAMSRSRITRRALLQSLAVAGISATASSRLLQKAVAAPGGMLTSNNFYTASEAARRIAGGTLTAETLMEECLSRIDEYEKEVGAWQQIDREGALAAARAADSGSIQGPLHGIPIGIKDIIDVAGMKSTCGSPIYSDNIAASDAACVAMAKDAGAIVLGKTVSTEFAAMTPGKTRNPHDLTRTPGGSSSGSAAALAYGSTLLALGTQTIGSTIRPATYCGVTGFKPSHGIFSLEGVKAQAESMDTLGLMARSVEDIVLFANSLLGVKNFAGNSTVASPIRIGICRTSQWAEAQPETASAINRAATAFESAGAKLKAIDLDDDFTRVLDAQWLILKFEFARALAWEHTRFRDQLSAPLRNLLDEGRTVSLDDYYSAVALTRKCRERIADYFEDVDIFLTPAAASEAPAFGAPTDLLFQRLWTVLRLPAITLPAFAGPNGLPVGIQLVGKAGDDSRFLALAGWAEKVLQ